QADNQYHQKHDQPTGHVISGVVFNLVNWHVTLPCLKTLHYNISQYYTSITVCCRFMGHPVIQGHTRFLVPLLITESLERMGVDFPISQGDLNGFRWKTDVRQSARPPIPSAGKNIILSSSRNELSIPK